MKRENLIKHTLTGLLVISLGLGLFQLTTLDIESESFGPELISGVYFLFLFVILTVYRIDWVGRKKVNWISLFLFVITIALLSVMLVSPKNILALWKYTLVAFVVYSAYIFALKTVGKSWIKWLTRALIIVTASILIYSIMMRTSNPLFYQASWYLLMATGAATLINIFLPYRK